MSGLKDIASYKTKIRRDNVELPVYSPLDDPERDMAYHCLREYTVSVGLGMIQSILEYFVYNGTILLPKVDGPPFEPCSDYLVGNIKQHGGMVTLLKY